MKGSFASRLALVANLVVEGYGVYLAVTQPTHEGFAVFGGKLATMIWATAVAGLCAAFLGGIITGGTTAPLLGAIGYHASFLALVSLRPKLFAKAPAAAIGMKLKLHGALAAVSVMGCAQGIAMKSISSSKKDKTR
jgi:hypothetical protein